LMFPESLLLIAWKTACTLCVSISYYTNLTTPHFTPLDKVFYFV